MNKILATVFLALSFQSYAGPYAKEANENPFLDGELNPKYEGELAAISGDIVKIIDMPNGYPLYKLNLNMAGIKPIWVTNIGSFSEGEITKNSKVIFRGYIASADNLDETGQIRAKTGSETLLLSIKVDSVK